MSGWAADDLDRIDAQDEVDISSYRDDGTLRKWVTIWIVRVGDELFVRSWKGRDSWWFRSAIRRGQGRIRAAGVERDVTLVEPDDSVHPRIDDAFLRKYGRYGNPYVAPMTGAVATDATLHLVPN